MTPRERLLATFRHEPVDRLPDYEFGAWDQTLARWHGEGLPDEYRGVSDAIDRYFRTDGLDRFVDAGVGVDMYPRFEAKVLEEKGDHLIVQEEDGAIAEMLRPELGASIPKYLRHALETRADWEKIRDERLDPAHPIRLAPDLEERCRASYGSERPVVAWCGSVYGYLRNWMGLENISLAIIEQPDWIDEMMNHMTELRLTVLGGIAGKCRVDLGHWWEDMCYNKGPLVSPRWFEEHMVPHYRRVTDFLRRECGCEFHMLDCDGNIHALTPLWLEAGINVLYPVEAAHTDGHALKSEHGSRLSLRGYFDKRALIAGKGAIDREFERLRPLLQSGGFIPHTDHTVPPDVSWDDYCYYRERKLDFIGKHP